MLQMVSQCREQRKILDEQRLKKLEFNITLYVFTLIVNKFIDTGVFLAILCLFNVKNMNTTEIYFCRHCFRVRPGVALLFSLPLEHPQRATYC